MTSGTTEVLSIWLAFAMPSCATPAQSLQPMGCGGSKEAVDGAYAPGGLKRTVSGDGSAPGKLNKYSKSGLYSR